MQHDKKMSVVQARQWLAVSVDVRRLSAYYRARNRRHNHCKNCLARAGTASAERAMALPQSRRYTATLSLSTWVHRVRATLIA